MPLETMTTNDSNTEASLASSVQAPGAPIEQPAVTQEGVVSQPSAVPGSPASVDGIPTEKVDASIAAPAPAEFPEEPPQTGAIKEGWRNLRSAYETTKTTIAQKDARITELEALVPKDDYFLKIDAPVDQLDFTGQLDAMKEKVPDYYNALGWSIMERHLPQVLPVFLEHPELLSGELKGLVEQSATAILQTYTGLQPQQIAAAVQAYKQGNGMTYTPAPHALGTQSPSIDANQIATQFGLDPQEPTHQPIINFIASQQKQLADVQASVSQLTSADENRTLAGSKAEVTKQVDSVRTNLLATATVPPGYEYAVGEITDRLNGAIERDSIVKQSRSNLELYYRQGTPDLQAAQREALTLKTRIAALYKEIAQPRLAEIAETERLKLLVSKTQTGVHNPTGSAGTQVNAQAPTLSQVPITSDNAADIALQRYRAAKLGQRPS